MSLRIAVLAFQGDVIEHVKVLEAAAKKIKINIEVIEVRTKENLNNIDGLIIPGGESTNFYKLCEDERMWEKLNTKKPASKP